MRSIGFLLDRAVKIREPRIPDSRLARVFDPQSYRMDDDIAAVFHHACASGDLGAADDLLMLLEKWHANRQYRDEAGKRGRATILKRLRCELDRQHIMGGTSIGRA